MNSPFFLLLGLLTCASTSWAQSGPASAGLYRSADDFRRQQLTMETNCQQAPFRVRLHEFGARSYITVIHQGRKDTLAKAAVYGYRDRDGREYRLANNQRFPILNPGEEVLLYKLEQATVGKNLGYVRLYFSATAASPIQPLTLLNLKRAFPTNLRLHEMLDAQFPAGRNLADLDEFHGMTRLNWLLQRSYALAEAR